MKIDVMQIKKICSANFGMQVSEVAYAPLNLIIFSRERGRGTDFVRNK